MTRLIFVNNVGKNENSYIVGSNIGSQSRFVKNALKRKASNNSSRKCCNYSITSKTYNIKVIVAVNDNGNNKYYLTGNDRVTTVSGEQVDVTLNVGDTVNFNVNASEHPFYIKTTPGTGVGDVVTNPVTIVVGTRTNGTVSWTPNNVGTYYYQCQHHTNMYGKIQVN